MVESDKASYKVAIAGAGGVGATIAYAALIGGVADRVALYDIDARKVDAEVADLRHGLQFVPPAQVSGSDDPSVCADADVVVLTAGAKQRPGQTRLDLAATNADLCRSLVPQLLAVAPDAVIVVVTNPVDVLTEIVSATLAASGATSTGRVLGSGTVLDTSRLRILLANRLGVSVANVHATIAGEHGDSEIALWSSATIGGVAVDRWVGPNGQRLLASERVDVLDEVRTAAERIIAGKGATTYAIGLATARILAAIRNDERAVLPVSTRHHFDEIGEVCLSLPTIVGRGGALGDVAVAFDDAELAGLRASARQIAAVLRSVS